MKIIPTLERTHVEGVTGVPNLRNNTAKKKTLRIYLSIRDDQVVIIMINLMLCLMKVVVYY